MKAKDLFICVNQTQEQEIALMENRFFGSALIALAPAGDMYHFGVIDGYLQALNLEFTDIERVLVPPDHKLFHEIGFSIY